MKEDAKETPPIPVNTSSVSARKTRVQAVKEFLKKESRKRFRKTVEKGGLILLLLGIVAIFFSFISTSTTLAFVGLTLSFWGILFLFVLPGRYVKSEVLDSMAFSSLSSINKLISESNCRGKAVYLPPYPKGVYVPKHFQEFKDGLVFISTKKTGVESSIEQAFMRKPKGMRLIPPGLDLANLLEKESGVNLSKTNPDFLTETLPNLLVHDLELAGDAKIDLGKDLVRVEIRALTCEDLCRQASKLTNICYNLGCPLCSSMACVLTRVTNRPVIIEECRLTNNILEAWYRILKD